MSALHTQVVSKLAASLEGTVRVATVVGSVSGLTLVAVLMGRMAALHTEVVSELAPGFEGAIGITLCLSVI
jgi:hypothetical protein